MGDLQDEISRIQTRLDGFLCQEQDSARIAIPRSMIPPIQRLPNEVLGDVFVNCAEERDVVVPARRRICPWTIGQVCSRWRWVQLRTPHIWNNVVVYDLSKPQFSTARAIINEILSSSDMLMSLKAVLKAEDQIVNTILHFSHRFRKLDITLDYNIYRHILGLRPGSFGALESLNVSLSCYNTGSSSPPHNISPFKSAPSLRSVSFAIYTRPGWKLPSHLYILPWAQLTEIQFHDTALSTSAIHRMLQHCPSLITSNFLVDDNTSEFPKDQIFLPNLRSLRLESVIMPGQDNLDWACFLQPFTVPSLEEFTIHTKANSWRQDALLSLVGRSGCAIKRIQIVNIDYGWRRPRSQEDTLLLALNSIVELETCFVIPASTLQRLAYDYQRSPLKELRCRVYPDGLDAFLDLMDVYIQDSSGLTGICSANIYCLESPGCTDAILRFKNKSPEYKRAGRSIGVSKVSP
jgi:hypothetical protein